ncbi:GFA family protein [Stenotrophomonas acidaminiphila]|uniref:GFA family protein n=1 Tax=Stenotrophomonas acidaminiphila TaxID=128780 RepID=UPI001375899F|nr:GFA family protein [Stenotrophomonas acidaminiphila]NCT88957.1 GFA family protein [Stenotrophomonas acidaminiphila]
MHYEGSCHCGRIAFAFESAEPIASAVSCNCSICRRRGSLLWFGPRSGFELRTDPAHLESYRFHSRHIDHHHCHVCGVAPFSEAIDPRSGQPTVAINLRCVPDVDLEALEIHRYDGASR